MALFVYVDNSNVQIEGQRVSAVKMGKAPDINTAMSNGVLDKSWGVDFGRLYKPGVSERYKDRTSSVARVSAASE